MSTTRTHALHHILHMQNLESFRHIDLRDFFVLETIGMPALDTGDMHMLTIGVMMMMLVFRLTAVIVIMIAHAILLLARTIIKRMQHVVLGKERKGTENGATIYGREHSLKIAHGKCIIERQQRAPHQNAHGSRSYAMSLEMLSNNLFIHIMLRW